MRTHTSISGLPNVPAVYALYGGRKQKLYVAYVGVANHLKNRIVQHLIRRNSSVTTGTSAVGLHPDYVIEVRWWEYPGFRDRAVLEAAELVAFDVFDPALRSRGNIRQQAEQLYADDKFREEIRSLLTDEPAGRLRPLTLQNVLERVADLEERLKAIEKRLGEVSESLQDSPR